MVNKTEATVPQPIFPEPLTRIISTSQEPPLPREVRERLSIQEGERKVHAADVPLPKEITERSLASRVTLLSERKDPISRESEFLNRPNSEWIAIIDDPEKFCALLPRLKDEDLLEALTLKDRKGDAIIHNGRFDRHTFPLLDKLKNPDLAKALICENSLGIAFVDAFAPALFKHKIFPLLARLDGKLLADVLTYKSRHGIALIERGRAYNDLLAPLIEKLRGEELLQILNYRDSKGQPLLNIGIPFLNTTANFTVLKELLGKAFAKLNTIEDEYGLTPEDRYGFIANHKISEVWLKKPKQGYETPILSREEYDKRSAALIEALNTKLDSVDISRINPKLVSDFISTTRGYLNQILTNIASQIVRAGTPEKDRKEEIHLFYTRQLVNLEKISLDLAGKTKDEDILLLFYRIVAPQKDGLCATAHQETFEDIASRIEAEHKAIHADPFDPIAHKTLSSFITEFISSRYRNDVHIYQQLQFLTGFNSLPDPVYERLRYIYPNFPRNKELFELLMNEISIEKFVQRMAIHAQSLNPSLLQNYISELFPDDYESHRKEYRETLRMARTITNAATESAWATLSVLDPTQAGKLMVLFRSPQGGALSYQKLPEETLKAFEEAWRPVTGKLRPSLDADPIEIRAYLTEGHLPSEYRIHINTWMNNQKSIQKLKEEYGVPEELTVLVLNTNNLFKKELSDWAEANKVDFRPSVDGTPIRSLLNEPREHFIYSHFNPVTGKLSSKGLLLILSSLGVIERNSEGESKAIAERSEVMTRSLFDQYPSASRSTPS